jgi:2-succinyl-5-enolpyruvyl-6-hydroxy-3-cyclohexene-1-carboxylate synthase
LGDSHSLRGGDLEAKNAKIAHVADPTAVYGFVGAFFSALRQSGVEHVVVSPGSRSTPLAIVAERMQGLRVWIELDERAAAFFALGLAKASGRPALLVCTSGTAAANYLPAVVEAHYSRVPLLVATADRPPELRDWGAGQTIDQVGLYGRYPRWSVEVPVPGAGQDARRYAAQLAGRAVETASARPAGAVHLNWPLREPLAPPSGLLANILTESAMAVSSPEFSRGRSVAADEDVVELVELVRSREKGVICCGPMDCDPALRSAILGFAAAAGWPVLADPASNLRSEVEVGWAPLLDRGDALTRTNAFVDEMKPDVVLRIGDTPVSKAQRLWIEIAEPESIYWLDEGGHWGEPSHRATRVVRGVATSLLDAAAARLLDGSFDGSYRDRGWCRKFEALNAVAGKAIEGTIQSEGSWSGLTVAATVARAVPASAQLFSSNSMSIRLLDLGFASRSDSLRVMCSRGASGIDGVTSTALGAAAASGQPTFLLTGDLAFLHDLSGLLLTRREAIPLTIIVVDDNGGGIFSFLPVAEQGEEVAFQKIFHTPHDLELADVAKLFQLDYQVVSGVGELETALGEAALRPGVSVIHVPVDAKTNEARFRSAVAAACSAVEAELGK